MLADFVGLEFGQGTTGWLVCVPDVWVLVGPQLGDSRSRGLEEQPPRWLLHPHVQPLDQHGWEAEFSWDC